MSDRANSSATVILSPSRNSNSVSLDIPKGLKTLLDDITKEVLHLAPESHQLYKVCADYLERRLIERDPISITNTPVKRLVSTYTTDSDSGLDVGATPHKGKLRSSKALLPSKTSSNEEGGIGLVSAEDNNIQERVLQQQTTSDFEEEEQEEDSKASAFSKKYPQSESILEIEATFQDSLLSRTELLLHESGILSPLNSSKKDLPLAGELKEIRLETLKRAKLPISVHLIGEKPNDSGVLPLRLFIDPEKRNGLEKEAQTSISPPVQDDVVARVLLEHAAAGEEEFDETQSNTRRTVNYLDLSKLGEEGETPASDEIWLPLGDEDKFLSSESETFSLATDKLSHIANMSGEDPPSHHSPMESEDFSKYMAPIQEGLALTSQNVLDLTGKFQGLETTLRDLCLTVQAIKSSDKFDKMEEVFSKMNEKCSCCSKMEEGAKNGSETSKSRTNESTQITDQLREDNSLLRQDLQRYREREKRLLERLEGLEHRLLGFNVGDHSGGNSPASGDRPSLPIIRTETKLKTKEQIPHEETILPMDTSLKSRRGSQDSRSSSAGNSRITARLRPINDITLARSDNTILRQDIQICRERESQLLMRAMDLEDKIIKVASTEDEASKKKSKIKPEVNINIDFGGDETTPGFSKTKRDKQQSVKVEIQDDNLKGDVLLSLDSNKNKTVSSSDKGEAINESGSLKDTKPDYKKNNSKDSKSSEKLESSPEKSVKRPMKTKEKDVKAPKSPEVSKSISKEETKKQPPSSTKVPTSTKRDEGNKLGKVPSKKNSSTLPSSSNKEPPAKAKEVTEKSSPGPPKVESSKATLIQDQSDEQQKEAVAHSSKKPSQIKKTSLGDSVQESNKVVKHDLFDGEDWRVTISSKHQLETISQGPQSITISPKPPTPPPPPPVKTPPKRAAEPKKEKVERRAVPAKKEKAPPSKADPIPKPSMFPVARPPRGHIPLPPQRTVPKNPYSFFPLQTQNPEVDALRRPILSTLPPSPPPEQNYPESKSFETPMMRSSPDGANSLGAIELKTEEEEASSELNGSQDLETEKDQQALLSFDLTPKRGRKPVLKYSSSLRSPFKKLRNSLERKLRLSKRSKSTSQLNQPLETSGKAKLSRSHHSVDRLPTLSAFDEERVIWLKSFEDDITYSQERRKMQSLKEVTPPDSSSSPASSASEEHIKQRKTPVQKVESESSSSDKELENNKKNSKRKHKKDRKASKPLVAECFIISRGWQMDQSRLIRALDRIKCTSFSRVQVATTVNRMVENLRPHQDVVVLHIGSQELLEASYGADDVSSVANSVSSVIGKHIANAAAQNRNTHFLVSLPLPRSVKQEQDQVMLRFHELRKAFNASLSSSLLNSINVQCIDNENMSQSGSAEGEPQPEYYFAEGVQLSSKGMRKLAKNWEEFLVRITKTKEGNIFVRRASDSSSSGSAKDNSRKL